MTGFRSPSKRPCKSVEYSRTRLPPYSRHCWTDSLACDVLGEEVMPPSRRPRGASTSGGGPAGKKQRGRGGKQKLADRDEVDSGDSDEDEAAAHAALLSKNEEDDALAAEPAEERRVRLAKEMLAAMDEAQSRRIDGMSAGRDGVARGAHEADAVAEALEEDALRRAGQWRNLVASKLRGLDQLSLDGLRKLRGPRRSPTCVAVAPDESFADCGFKDGSIVRWELPSGRSVKLAGGRSQALYGEAAMELQQQAAKAAAGEDGGEEDEEDEDEASMVGATAYARRSDRCPRLPRRRRQTFWAAARQLATSPTC